MHASKGYTWSLVGWCMLMACSVGCTDTYAILPSTREENRKKADELARYGATPPQKIEQLQLLYTEAPKKSAAEQQQLSTALAQQLQNERDPLVRCQLLRTLGQFPTETAHAALRAGLQDTNSDVRITCCQVWSKQTGPEAARALGGIVGGDTDLDVRLAAVKALGSIHDPATVAALTPALDDSNPAMQFRAVASMKAVSGKDLGTDVSAWRQFAHSQVPATTKDESVASRAQTPY